MRNPYVAAAALCCIALPAQAMTVAEFLARVHRLEANGLGAVFSSDIELLKAEMNGIVAAYIADLKAARRGKTTAQLPAGQGEHKLRPQGIHRRAREDPRGAARDEHEGCLLCDHEAPLPLPLTR